MAGNSKPDFGALKAKILNAENEVIQDLIDYLCMVGEEARNAAVDWTRQAKPYKDQTRHLRGSIGYVVSVDGQVVHEGEFGAADSAEEGRAAGRAYAREVVSTYPKGVTLIIVAGKEYASYVANRGYDVLDSAWITAQELIPKVLEMVGAQIERDKQL